MKRGILRYGEGWDDDLKHWTDSAFPGDGVIYGGAAAAKRVEKAVDDLGDDVFIHDERPVRLAATSDGDGSPEQVGILTKWVVVPEGGGWTRRKHYDYFLSVGKITRDGKLRLRGGGGESLRMPGLTLDEDGEDVPLKASQRAQPRVPKEASPHCVCPPPKRGRIRLQLDSYPPRCSLCRKVLP